MNATFLDDSTLADLLVSLETEGLTPAERRELDGLLDEAPGASLDALAGAAAALTLAARLPSESMPASLKQRIIERGRTEVARAAAARVVPLAPKGEPVARKPVASSFGWYAAAASVLLAVAAWWPRLAEQPADIISGPTPVPTPAEQRTALLASGDTLFRKEWTATEDAAAAGLTGDVVWDPDTQTGYMRFFGLAANDASQQQYQLWIFDSTRDDRYPVDGGVFDVPVGATEVIVPIRARLPVRDAALFAVTVEPPGGVVVSSRERIVALAQATAG